MIGVAPPAYDPAAPTTANTLPVGAARDRTRLRAPNCSGGTAAPSSLLITVNTVAVVASMAGPYLLGDLVERVSDGARDLHLELTIALFAARAGRPGRASCGEVRLRGAMLGEQMLADLREDFLVRSVGLPPGVLERAGTGDLLSRITTDIDRLANAMREAVPQLAIGVVWVAAAARRARVTAPPLAPAVLIAVPLLVVGCRWYFKRAPCRLPFGGRRVRRRRRRPRRDRRRGTHRGGPPARRPPHRAVGAPDQGVDRLGATTRSGCGRSSSPSSTSPM